MEFRRSFALLFSVAICAGALMYMTPMPDPDFDAPQAIGPLASIEFSTESDATMLALQQQAHAALANLQASAARP